MPHRLMNELVRRLPKSDRGRHASPLVDLDDLVTSLKLPLRTLKRIVKMADRQGLVGWWPETRCVFLAPEVAAEHGFELWSSDTPDPGPEDWRWAKVGDPYPIKARADGGIGIDPSEPDPFDQIAVLDGVVDPDGPEVTHWLGLPGTTSPPAMRRDDEPKKKRGRPDIWGDWNGTGAFEGALERRALPATPKVNVQGVGTSWTPAIEVPGNPECSLCGTGSRLSRLGYCLACSRFGLDHLLPEVKPDEMPKETAAVDEEELAGGVGPVKEAVAA